MTRTTKVLTSILSTIFLSLVAKPSITEETANCADDVLIFQVDERTYICRDLDSWKEDYGDKLWLHRTGTEHSDGLVISVNSSLTSDLKTVLMMVPTTSCLLNQQPCGDSIFFTLKGRTFDEWINAGKSRSSQDLLWENRKLLTQMLDVMERYPVYKPTF